MSNAFLTLEWCRCCRDFGLSTDHEPEGYIYKWILRLWCFGVVLEVWR